MKIEEFKKENKISMVTCYDSTFAKAVEASDIDCVLVGDSVAMVIYGESSTTHATIKMIERHVKAVRKEFSGFLVADLPFISLQKSQTDFVLDAKRLINAGAQAIKIEGVTGHEDKIKSLVLGGVPVMGHVGLTPQFLNSFGGFKVQGRDEKKSQYIIDEVKKLEDLGAFSIVVECVPAVLAETLNKATTLPLIGIGAGSDLSGQVLVLQDLLGLNTHKFKFVKRYHNLFDETVNSINLFSKEVKSSEFPKREHEFI